MNNKIKAVLGILALVVFIGGAYFAYNALSDRYKPSNKIKLERQDQASQSSVSNSTQSAKNSVEDTQKTDADNGTQAEDTSKMKAPDFTVLDSEGKSVKLSDLFGKPIVLNFWASWCPPCKGEMPHFDKVYAEVKDDIIFMMVDLTDGQRETVDKGKEYIKKMDFTFPVYFDTEQEAAYAYGIQSIPTTLFIDSEGYIVTGAEGAIDEETLLKGIEYIK